MARNFVLASAQYLTNAAAIGAYPFYMGCWFRKTSAASAGTLITIATGGATNHHHRLSAAVSGGAATTLQAISRTTSNAIASSSANWVLDTWHHGLGYYESATSRGVLLDGANTGTNATSLTPAGMDETNIGRLSSATTLYFEGDAAEAAIWTGTAAEAAIAAAMLAKGASPLLVFPSNLLAYWPLIGRTDPEIELIGGQGMTLVNAPINAAHPRVYYPRRSQGVFMTPLHNLSLMGVGG